jgi:hypothetical protein
MICADLMEAMFYTCTKSSQGNFPCPMCLVPKEELSQLERAMNGEYEARRVNHMRMIYMGAQRRRTATSTSADLRDYGLQDVDVSLSIIGMHLGVIWMD